ncbi:uncharacterized protein [Argopecten irradians]|uniref:uncharacterized protein n=1 Tax=Argopecten irradians TaxID=31199 RepID=UPI0037189313
METLFLALLLYIGQTSAVNFTNILHQYYLTCGQTHLCGDKTLTDDVDLTRTHHGPRFCPRCQCDRHCLKRKDCCPDVMFAHPGLVCMDLAVFNPRNFEKNTTFALTECPKGTSETIARKCSGNYTSTEKFTVTPVSSADSFLVYRNKYCAECFGEISTIPWSLNIDCEGMIDLNHLTSYDAILDVIENNRCSMIYQSPNHQRYVDCDIPKKLKDPRKLHLEECNITGTWASYDPDINWACRTVDQPYKHYKNMFCYICNPGIQRRMSKVIGRCNQTGAWPVQNETLQRLCESTPLVAGSFPFKNVFCYQCNRNTSNADIFLDASIVMATDLSDGLSIFGFQITSFNNLKVVSADQPIMKTINKNAPFYGGAATVFGNKVDIQKLLFIHFLHYGHQRYCDKTISFVNPKDTVGNLQDCGCDVTCVLRSDCCTDFAMTSPMMVSKHFSGYVVAKCYNVTDIPYLMDSCENRNTDASFAHIPIVSSQSGVRYRNVYCLICNEGRYLLPPARLTRNVNISLSQTMFEKFDLELECNFIIKHEEFYLLSELIKNIEHNIFPHNRKEKCTMKLYSDGRRLKYWIHDRSVSTCNVTGAWGDYDPDIEWACENYLSGISHFIKYEVNGYRNIFCKICNSNSPTNLTTIDTCDKKGHLTPVNVTMTTRCGVYPQSPSMTLYKNRFCAECYISSFSMKVPDNSYQNVIQNDAFKSDDCYNLLEIGPIIASTYRKMFKFKAIADYTVLDDIHDANVSGKCGHNEVYDSRKEVCRPLHCFEGKYLSNNDCRPFLPHATLLGYAMAAKVMVYFTPLNNETVGEVMRPIRNVIDSLISTNLKIMSHDIEYVSLYMLVHQDCASRYGPSEQPFLLHTSFLISAMADRIATENKLLNMTSSNFSLPCLGTMCHVEFAYDKDALELPTIIHTVDLEESCYLVSHQQVSFNSDIYKLKYVSKFLACQHVEIDEDQYEYQENKFHIKLLPNGPKLKFGEFRKNASSSLLQICIDDFDRMMASHVGAETNSIEDTVKFVLQVMSFTCVCLSVLGLFITFLTYCFFSPLRTLPGKNNMCLIASLFFSQFLTQLGILQSKDRKLCATFGLLIHYFWLATFFSMNVCSYHMFQVFVFPLKLAKDKKSERLTHICYLGYCLGLPIVIISVYVGISVSGEGSIGYGSDNKCFISSLLAFMASFIGPIFIICLANIVFFSVTAYHISKVPRVTSNKSSRREVTVHIKLFLLTGISWIFQLIDSFVPMSFFSIVVNLVNASQGIFIFMAYSVNRRVRSYYRQSLTLKTLSAVLTSSSGRGISSWGKRPPAPESEKSSKETPTENRI